MAERPGSDRSIGAAVRRVPAWLARLRLPTRRPPGHEIVYESGSEFDPGDPFGLCVLTLRPDASAVLVTRLRGRERRYEARTAPGVLDRVLGHLRDGGFPEIPPHRTPSGPTRRLAVSGGGSDRQTPVMAFHEAAGWPGYGPAFGLLDSLVVAVSRGEIRVVPTPLPDLLAAPRRRSRGRVTRRGISPTPDLGDRS